MSYTAKDVMELRAQTGVGMMDCKKALEESGGDMKKAQEYLRKLGLAVAAKKASRIAAEGVVAASISKDGKSAALIELNCESDFVAKGDAFLALAQQIADITLKDKPSSLDDLLAKKIGTETIQEAINNATAKIGEKISLRRFALQKVKQGLQEKYIHMMGKIGVILEVETDKDLNKNKEFIAVCHDVAMHVAAMNPKYNAQKDVPQSDVDSEKEIFLDQVLKSGKPPQVAEKIVEGKVKKFFKENCLLEQEFFKDPSFSIGAFVQNAAKKLEASISVTRFTRFEKGEGIEKRVDNLADEVAKLNS